MNPQTQPRQLPGPPKLNGRNIQNPITKVCAHLGPNATIGPIKAYTEFTTLPLHPPARKKHTRRSNLDPKGAWEWRKGGKLVNKWREKHNNMNKKKECEDHPRLKEHLFSSVILYNRICYWRSHWHRKQMRKIRHFWSSPPCFSRLCSFVVVAIQRNM